MGQPQFTLHHRMVTWSVSNICTVLVENVMQEPETGCCQFMVQLKMGIWNALRIWCVDFKEIVFNDFVIRLQFHNCVIEVYKAVHATGR